MLEAIGLTPVESRLYMALVDNPRSTAPELAKHCELSTRAAARALGQFVRRGFASRLPGKQPTFIAVAPDVSIQPLLSRREDELNQVRTAVHDLTAAFHRASRHTHPAELVEVITGADNIASRAFALQETMQSMLRGIDKPPYVMGSGNVNAARELRRLAQGIEYRVIYDREAVVIPGKLEDIRTSIERGEKARVMVNAPLKLWMVDDSAAIIPIRSSAYSIAAAFVVHPSALLDALIVLFELVWQRAVPLRPAAAPHASTHGASPPEPHEGTNALLTLLASGLTDEAIARSLGLSLRTVQRRIHDLMSLLGAGTRFQAGMAARDRGWI
ncbi:helix-turn-helix domain-containing protein [Asanoa sp. NPDC049573]|uniref:helix-turn-helix transcriptional regulator n=1 Tax=Asanoa sp. NPDC049573 TaxID=3155396 RepID=UPI003429103A